MTYTYNKDKRCPLQCEPGVLSAKIQNADASNVPIYVPWRDVELVFAYTSISTAIDSGDGVAITLQKDASGGTTLGAITIAASAAVGDIDEATMTPGTRLDYRDSGMDAVNVKVNGDASPAGAFNIYLYFERIDRDG